MNLSVVVRCAGREMLFNGVLKSLVKQTTAPSEILVVMDSNSEKEIRYVSRRLQFYPNAKLVSFRHEEFSHPHSVNLGVASSSGELVCITNGHSLPISLSWLENGLDHFEDNNVAGVSGFFFPSRKGFSKRLFYLVEVQLNQITWLSTMNCIIRKSRWIDYPFDESLPSRIPEAEKLGGEDYDWTLEMMARGYRIVLDPKFSIVHAHEDDIILEMYRNLKAYFDYKKLRERIKLLPRPREAIRLSTS